MDHLIIAQATESQVTMSAATVITIISTVLSFFIMLFNIYLASRFKTVEESHNRLRVNQDTLFKKIGEVEAEQKKMTYNYLDRFNKVESKIHGTETTIVSKINEMHDKVISKIDDMKENIVTKETCERFHKD